MAKRYHRNKLSQAIAAACLSVTVIPAISATSALATVTVSSTYTVNTGSGNPGQVILGNSGVLIVDTPGNGGTVSGSSVGVKVTGGATAGSITNNGTISGSSTGIFLSGSSISGGIVNNGTIHGSNIGIDLNNSSIISGGIINNGTISGGSYGIRVTLNSDISGRIFNNAGGSIVGATAGIFVDSGSHISGGITNDSDILSNNAAIKVDNSSDISGGIINLAHGNIHGSQTGIMVSQHSDISGGITNSGLIHGMSNVAGIAIISGSNISGGIVNNVGGDISGNLGTGILVDAASNISGGISNSGTIGSAGVGPQYAIKILNPAATIIIDNAGRLNGKVELANSTLNLNGPSSQVTGAVTGGATSTVNVNGTFWTADTFSVGTFAVNSGGTFNMMHDVTTVHGVTNAGTLSVPEGSTVNIAGNYTQTATGMLETGASSAASYGQLNVTGTADISANNKIHVVVTPGDTLVRGDVLHVLTAGTLIAGPALTVTDDSAMWNFTGAVVGNAIDFTVARALTIAEAVTNTGISPGSIGAARALDTIGNGTPTVDMQTVLNEMGALATQAGVASAAAQTMPIFTGDQAHITLGLINDGATKIVHDRVVRLNGLSSGDALLQDKMVWVQPFGSWTKQNERKGVDGYKADSFGVALGTDAKVAGPWRVGAAVSFARGNIDGDSPVTRDNLDINTYQATVYATDELSEGLNLNLQAAFGVNTNDSSRHIVFGGLNRVASADFTSWQTALDAELAKTYKVGEKTTLTPAVRAQYSYVKVDDYTETGAGAINLHVDDNSEDSLILSIGVKGAHALSDALKLTGHLDVGYDLSAGQSSVTATFMGGGSSFITYGIDPAPLLVRGGLGLDVLKANGLEVTARYDVEAREDFTNQVASINFRMPF